MSAEYTPTVNDALRDYVAFHTRNYDEYQAGESTASVRAVYEGEFRRMLATVRPNPDDARQVEVVARALCEYHGYEPDRLLNNEPTWHGWIAPARAVLTALAAMGGELA